MAKPTVEKAVALPNKCHSEARALSNSDYSSFSDVVAWIQQIHRHQENDPKP